MVTPRLTPAARWRLRGIDGQYFVKDTAQGMMASFLMEGKECWIDWVWHEDGGGSGGYCEVVGAYSSAGTAFQAAFEASPQSPGGELCSELANVA